MIDDFSLRGSRRCRRTHAPLTKEEWLIQVAHQVAHAYGNRNATLSEGAPSLLWSGPCLESLVGGGMARIPRVGCDKAKRGCSSCFRASPGAPYGREEGGESDPVFFGAGAPRGRAKGDRGPDTLCLPLFGVALTTEIPGGKAIERCRGQGGSTGRSGFPTGGGTCDP